ncbi:MAG: sigma-70 family RNA polymerase sigma factor [Planctomycetales bacterium]|nr:sigma-70 family RNA polymerase sigma factor [Planctomycetales bacterium]
MDDFQTTHWSLVVAAGQRLSPQSDRALSELCRKYWLPLYGYVRRRVTDVHEAQDLTQDFFCRVLERNFFAAADPGRGRFRAFLLTSLKHFLANEWEKGRTQKRGGGLSVIELDFAVGESRLSLEPAHEETPERLFDRQWALTLLDLVLARLRIEFREAGKEDQFEQLKPFLSGARERSGENYVDVGRAAGMTAEAVKVAAHRLRQRYRELLRAEIAQTVAQPGDVDDEIRDLFHVLGS